jgi:hypothetical protein
LRPLSEMLRLARPRDIKRRSPRADCDATLDVATRSTMELTWTGSVALHDAAADVARLKRKMALHW